MTDKSSNSPDQSLSISLSISIVCFNSSVEELMELIDSLLQSIQFLKSSAILSATRVVLIDNSEEEELTLETFSRLRTQAESFDVQLELLQGHGNIGYGAAHNLVVNSTDSDYHLLLNPDLILGKNCLSAGINYLAENEKTVLVSPHAEHENGEKQYLCKRYPSVFTFIVRGFYPDFLKKFSATRLAKFEMHEISEEHPTAGIPIVSGCFMLCRTEALQQLKGFDEGYFLYFEDFDLSLRLSEIGEIAYLPAMRITHAGGHAARKGWKHIQMFVRSGRRFFQTHGWRIFSQPD